MIDALINSITEKSLSNFIRTRNSKFKEYKEDLSYLVNDFDQFDNLSKLGEIKYDNTDVLLVFSCAYNGILSTRSARKMQFEIAKKALKEDFKDGAVFVFYDEVGKFRFSFIRKNYGDREQKYTNWKRFTYFVDSVSQTNRTFKDRIGECNFDSLENIQNAFSVEPISKAFFDGYKAQYEKFCAFMQTDKKIQYNFREFLTDGTNKAVRDYVKKMLGRIVFLHFLQKKGWMGVPSDSIDWTGGDQNFIENLFKNSNKEQQANFLDKVLEPMFFYSLNTPSDNDLYNTNTNLGVVKIPYLNGGLFEPDSLDEPESIFPASYFKELFKFFNEYNFTIDENDPNDAEVGVDPEMLGHIFENLLEDNKDKGAFYTPKEIVHYMCHESLIEYLCTSLGIEKDDEKYLIQVMVKYQVIDEKLHSRISEIITALDKVKICDPAIGSGAFPMGLLHEIFTLKQALWFLEHNDLETFPASEVKLNIIQNSIYGVDIDKGAVDIARLRFWLSLVVDEDEPKPLPNLDYKIMQGNSLVESFEGHDLSKIIKPIKISSNPIQKNLLGEYVNPQLTMGFDSEQTKANLNILLQEYFKTNNSEIKRSKKTQINEQVSEHIKNCAGHTPEIIEKVNSIDFNDKPFFLWHLYFADVFANGGFDIVIGNPPYVDSENMTLKNPELRELLKESFKTTKGNWDLFIPFVEFGFLICKLNGVFSYIIPNKLLSASYSIELRRFLSFQNIIEIRDYSRINVFETASVYPITLVVKKTNLKSDVSMTTMQSTDLIKVSYKIQSNIFYNDIFWDKYFLEDKFVKILIKLSLLSNFKMIPTMKMCGAATVNEAYEIKEKLVDSNSLQNAKKLINTGTIDRWTSLWGIKNTQYIKSAYKYPTISDRNIKLINETRLKQSNSSKVIIAGMSKEIEAFLDVNGGYMAGKSTTIIMDEIEKLKIYCTILNSKVSSFFVQSNYHSLKMAGGYLNINNEIIGNIPFPEIKEANKHKLISFVDRITESIDEGYDTILVESDMNNFVFRLFNLSFNEIIVIDPSNKISKSDYEAITID